MRKRGSNHNDLHAENVMVVELDDARSRRRAIDPHAAVRILDLGSAASHSASSPTRLGDIEWVAVHIRDMVKAYERNHPEMPQDTLRLCTQLRRAAEFYSTPDIQRQPEPAKMQSYIRSIPPTVPGRGTYRSSLTGLPSTTTPRLSPHGMHPSSWSTPKKSGPRSSGGGPALVAGLRGCGKTILLRSLSGPHGFIRDRERVPAMWRHGSARTVSWDCSSPAPCSLEDPGPDLRPTDPSALHRVLPRDRP